MGARRIVAIIVSAALALVFAPSVRASSATTDWAVVTVTAGPEGATNAFILVRGSAASDGSSTPSVYGSGFAIDGWNYVSLWELNSPMEATVATPAGQLHETLAPQGSTRLGFSSSFSGDLAPFEMVKILKFTPGMTLDVGAPIALADAGTLTVSAAAGSGSKVVPIAGDGDQATALVAPWHAAGTTAHSATPQDAIVGAVATHSVAYGTWQAPGGPVTAWADTPAIGLASHTFAGPAGEWKWTWTGATTSDPTFDGPTRVVGAYAPIGIDWTAFAP